MQKKSYFLFMTLLGINSIIMPSWEGKINKVYQTLQPSDMQQQVMQQEAMYQRAIEAQWNMHQRALEQWYTGLTY